MASMSTHKNLRTAAMLVLLNIKIKKYKREVVCSGIFVPSSVKIRKTENTHTGISLQNKESRLNTG